MKFGHSKQGLYDPQFEHDNCGVGFIVDIQGRPSRKIVEQGLKMLCRLEHRGAYGADPETGDGAGILLQIDHHFFKAQCQLLSINLPDARHYGIGTAFVYQNKEVCQDTVCSLTKQYNLKFLGWRDVPVDPTYVGKQADSARPEIVHFFIGKEASTQEEDFERQLYVLRRQIEKTLGVENCAITGISCRKITYKGMLTPDQMHQFYLDLADPSYQSALAMAHTRFPTNTLPRWEIAQPFRYLAHNGEINTLRGNVNWTRAREALIQSNLYDKIEDIFPIISDAGSDSSCFDNVLEFLILSGYSIAQAIMMMVPEAWDHSHYDNPERKAFYEFFENFIEPWDGPAAIAITDGIRIGATLDRNGLRPARYVVTKNDVIVMASEAGAIDIAEEDISLKGRLEPGRMFFVDTEQKRIISGPELKTEICKQFPYAQWIQKHTIRLEDLPQPNLKTLPKEDSTIIERQRAFGYSVEDLHMILKPMIVEGAEATGSMGNDAPLAVLSDKPHILSQYFKQLFAQVSNPAVDSVREELVMSLVSRIGREHNILKIGPEHAQMIRLEHPIITNEQFQKIQSLKDFNPATFSILCPQDQSMRAVLDQICQDAIEATKSGSNLIILSDRGVCSTQIPIPVLLATSAVHHSLIRAGRRGHTGLIIETGEAREIAHFCLLIGYGAGAINPYLAFETFEQMQEERFVSRELSQETLQANYLKSIKKGMFKVFAKMGISTIQSYRGAQIFEAVGLNQNFVDRYFTGTPTRIQGLDLEDVEREARMRVQNAFVETQNDQTLLVGGDYFWRRHGEIHQYTPASVISLQKASRENSLESYREFSRMVNANNTRFATLRGALDFVDTQNAIEIEEVEPAKEIVRRFATGAMSLGSISQETHEALAIAMNRIGAKSNSGEGGEDQIRFKPFANGDWANSNIKQVASGRFGVTIHYLVNCVELQIKIAQGAKPGEGGQLPGHKVSEYIGKIRHSTPGVTLISPPPHHDIYSIEDLAQLIFDLKNANPKARIAVKLVSEAGVGTIASGVAKAHADMIVIAGHDGGTGASPLTSIKHAGLPWELGIAEAHQTLLLNELRGRVRLQVDGQVKTGREVVIAALLGAEEIGFATAPLITLGCIMMRKCHLNTCPVGVATQDAELRKKFTGKPEYVVNYFFFIAEEVREIMAKLGIKRFDQLVGRTDLLKQRDNITHWKAKKIDLSQLLTPIKVGENDFPYCNMSQNHGLDKQLDHQLIELAKPALEHQKPVRESLKICNTNRSVGTMLSGQVALKYEDKGLPHHLIRFHFTGSAGQSFGAFLAKGITLELEGDANDYTGKGLSGGRVIVYPSPKATFQADENIIIGNTTLYGATSGTAFFCGIAGERFAVRNSGAYAVVEGVGDHGCEYMTGGRVVVLGKTGKNFAAGMSGGIAYVFDEEKQLATLCNHSMVELETIDEQAELIWLKELIEDYVQETQSKRGQHLLKHWQRLSSLFVRVMPVEYRAILKKQKVA